MTEAKRTPTLEPVDDTEGTGTTAARAELQAATAVLGTPEPSARAGGSEPPLAAADERPPFNPFKFSRITLPPGLRANMLRWSKEARQRDEIPEDTIPPNIVVQREVDKDTVPGLKHSGLRADRVTRGRGAGDVPDVPVRPARQLVLGALVALAALVVLVALIAGGRSRRVLDVGAQKADADRVPSGESDATAVRAAPPHAPAAAPSPSMVQQRSEQLPPPSGEVKTSSARPSTGTRSLARESSIHPIPALAGKPTATPQKHGGDFDAPLTDEPK